VSDPFIQLVLSAYPLNNYPPPPGYSVSAPLALGAMGTDIFSVCTARKADLSLLQYVPTYTYEFNDETAPSLFPSGTLNFPLGDSHFIEVPYLFNFGAPFTPDQQQLSDTMIGYWTQFAKTGNPNSEGAPNRRLYTGAGGQFESLISPTPTTELDSSFDTDHKCFVLLGYILSGSI
jgi:para-nitrobenzyl esterase